jgi:hypothetical protein
MLDPKSFTDTLQKKYNFKLKGTGPIDFHLGQSFSRNEDGEMEISAKRYVDKMMDTYVQLYGEKPRKTSSPLEQNDHPEMERRLSFPRTRRDTAVPMTHWSHAMGSIDRKT